MDESRQQGRGRYLEDWGCDEAPGIVNDEACDFLVDPCPSDETVYVSTDINVSDLSYIPPKQYDFDNFCCHKCMLTTSAAAVSTCATDPGVWVRPFSLSPSPLSASYAIDVLLHSAA